jgi:hypothetical protein
MQVWTISPRMKIRTRTMISGFSTDCLLTDLRENRPALIPRFPHDIAVVG